MKQERTVCPHNILMVACLIQIPLLIRIPILPTFKVIDHVHKLMKEIINLLMRENVMVWLASQSASQPVSQPASQPASQLASQPASQLAS